MGDDQVVARLRAELWALIEQYAQARDGETGDLREAQLIEDRIWAKLDELVGAGG